MATLSTEKPNRHVRTYREIDMSTIKLYNLTLSKINLSDQLASSLNLEVEAEPRMRPPADLTDWPEIKAIVRDAVCGIPQGAHVLVDGSPQFASLVQDLAQFRLVFGIFDAQTGDVVDVIGFQGWGSGERWQLQAEIMSNGRKERQS